MPDEKNNADDALPEEDLEAVVGGLEGPGNTTFGEAGLGEAI